MTPRKAKERIGSSADSFFRKEGRYTDLLSSVSQSWPARYGASFSYWGLVIATLFFAASLTPSLLPRHFAVQGLLSGLALAVGYGVGVLLVWVWRYLELPRPGARLERVSKQITAVCIVIVMGVFLWYAAAWQNSIRQLMEMEPVISAYPWRVGVIAVLTGVLLVAMARGLRSCWRYVDRKISKVVPRRVSQLSSAVIVVVGLSLILNDVIGRLALDAADALFVRLDRIIDEGVEQPTAATASGSAGSMIGWDTIGRFGKGFVAAGPTRQQISQFWGKEVLEPLRVYVGLNSRDTLEARAELALQELIRVGGFDRSTLVVATPTGTGWLDPGAVDTLEFLHAGDTAIVSMQYSYLPSWLTILVDPERSRDSATVLFDKIYFHWKTLPRAGRPKLYVHGLSLGALGSAASADLFTVFEDPIQGGLWSGPPFPSTVWSRATRIPKSRLADVASRISGRFDVAIHRAKKLVDRRGETVGTDAICVHSTCQRPDDIFRLGTVVPQA